MTTNTARSAAAADGAWQTARSGGTSVLLQNLSRSFGSTRALDGLSIELDGLSIEIAPGELVALLGPSGCGKTTALRIVAGFESADAGSVTVDGKDMSSVPASRRDRAWCSRATVCSRTCPRSTTWPSGCGSANWARRSGASGPASCWTWSGWPRRPGSTRTSCPAVSSSASRWPALAIEPRVLLLDEPLSALDAKVRLQLREQIRTLQQRLGTTTLFVTHDQEEALSMADRVGVMRQGKLEQIAAPDELYDDPATAFVAEFVGIMNRIPGEMRAGGMVAVLGGAVPVKSPVEAPDSGQVDVLARPEGLTLQVAENGNGIVTTRTFLGSVTRVGVQLSGDVAIQIDKSSSEAAALAPSASVTVSLPAQPVLVVPRRPVGA